jgi:hypothetical protein
VGNPSLVSGQSWAIHTSGMLHVDSILRVHKKQANTNSLAKEFIKSALIKTVCVSLVRGLDQGKMPALEECLGGFHPFHWAEE